MWPEYSFQLGKLRSFFETNIQNQISVQHLQQITSALWQERSPQSSRQEGISVFGLPPIAGTKIKLKKKTILSNLIFVSIIIDKTVVLVPRQNKAQVNFWLVTTYKIFSHFGVN